VADNTVIDNADNYNLSVGNQLNLLLCQIPETLDWPCSTKLAGTLICPATGTNGITVNANDVTIDMAGHTLIGPGASSGSGIYQSDSYRNLTVRNGKVINWRGGFHGGIYADGDSAILSGLQASTNDYGIRAAGTGSAVNNCAAHGNGIQGIYAGYGSTVTDCAANDNRYHGIVTRDGSTVTDCAAQYNILDGINVGDGSTINNCAARNNGYVGILANEGSMVVDCAASYNGGAGIYAFDGSTVTGCAARNNGGDGIRIYSDCRITGCVCHANGNNADGAGILVFGDSNRIEGNTTSNNDRGIDVDGTHNLIIRNSASFDSTNYSIVVGNCVGPIVLAPITSTAIEGNTGGAGVGSTDPWANFSF